VSPPASSTRRLRSAALGKTLLAREWPAVERPLGDVLLLHGLGDHSGWHSWAAGLVAGAGYRAASFDWPGNGASEGIRGDMPAVAEAGDLLDEMMEAMDLAPVGIFAHSTGAFLLLPWLARRSREAFLARLRWVWLSSPLLRPSHGQPRLKIALASALARRFPKLTLGSGVRARDCFHTGASAAEAARRRDGGHHRVSLRFATDLLAAEGAVMEEAARIRPDLSFLLTQGAEDGVCPPPYAEELFRHLPGERKTWLLVSGARHEPHREAEPEGIANAVRAWLDRESHAISAPDRSLDGSR